jgi:transposase
VTQASLPAGVPSGSFGPGVAAIVSLVTGKYRLSKRLAQQLVSDVLGIELCIGSIANLEQQMSTAVAAPVEHARDDVRQQSLVNIDETGWYEGREGGRARRAWLWVAVTSLVTVFRISLSRGAQVAQEILGAEFAGRIGSDRGSAYNWLAPSRRQLCWSHLSRDFQGFVDRGGLGGEIGQGLLDLVDRMFQWWHRVRDGTLSRASFQRRAQDRRHGKGDPQAPGRALHLRRRRGH